MILVDKVTNTILNKIVYDETLTAPDQYMPPSSAWLVADLDGSQIGDVVTVDTDTMTISSDPAIAERLAENPGEK